MTSLPERIRSYFNSLDNENSIVFILRIVSVSLLISLLIFGALSLLFRLSPIRIPVGFHEFIILYLFILPVLETVIFQFIPVRFLDIFGARDGIKIIFAWMANAFWYVIFGAIAFFSIGLISSFFFAYSYTRFAQQSHLKGLFALTFNRFLYNSFLLGTISLLFISGIDSTVSFPGKNQKGFQLYRMPTSSMAPTIHSNEMILIHTGHYLDRAIQRQELIFFKYEEMYGEPLMKRIVALEGDTVSIQTGVASVNGENYDERYVANDNRGKSLSRRMQAQKIPKDHIFILGDNRDNSYDSRFWGPIPDSTIIGKPIYIVWSGNSGRIGRIR